MIKNWHAAGHGNILPQRITKPDEFKNKFARSKSEWRRRVVCELSFCWWCLMMRVNSDKEQEAKRCQGDLGVNGRWEESEIDKNNNNNK